MFQQNRVFAPEKMVAAEGYGASCLHSNESGSLEPVSEEGHHLVLEYKIGGPLTYVTASAHCKRFLDLAVDRVLINLSHVTRIDHDGIAALEVRVFSLIQILIVGCCPERIPVIWCTSILPPSSVFAVVWFGYVFSICRIYAQAQIPEAIIAINFFDQSLLLSLFVAAHDYFVHSLLATLNMNEAKLVKYRAPTDWKQLLSFVSRPEFMLNSLDYLCRNS